MVSQREVCSYQTKCYRRNPDHFKEVDHPHLDKLLIGCVEGRPVNIPERLDFECQNRSLLLEQLEMLRKIKRQRFDQDLESIRKNRQANFEASTSREREPLSSRREASPPRVDITKVTEVPPKRPSQDKILEVMAERGELQKYVPKRGGFLQKFDDVGSYKIFFTAVQKSSETWEQKRSVTFSEILDDSFGEIVSSMHVTFIVNIGWLCSQYMLAGQKPNMLVFYQHREDEYPLPDNIKAQAIKSPFEYGSHHSKLSILHYKDNSIRIIVSTANLYSDDWDIRTQGLWISAPLPQMPTGKKDTDGESSTGFKADFIRYFKHYKENLHKFRYILTRADFSSVNVFFIASVPCHGGSADETEQWGQNKMAKVLRLHSEVPAAVPTSIVATVSSIGNMGPSWDSWIRRDIVANMSKNHNVFGQLEPDFKLIYPSNDSYRYSYDLMEQSNCLSYTELTHRNQKWIRNHMHEWIATQNHRSKAMPHIKTFLRLSVDEKRAYWMLLGSANLSKAAWGYRDPRGSYKILSYEAGVLFLPKFFNGGIDFPLGPIDSLSDMPIPYDLPLTKYSDTDEPFLVPASIATKK